MAYYVFKITQPTPIVKNLDFLTSFEAFKEAKVYARAQRAELPAGTDVEIKMVHAVNQLQAEEILLETREKPVLMEWEK